MLPILQALIEGQPRAPDAPVQTGLQTALTTLRPLLQPGSLVLLLSDFAQVDPPLQDMLAGALSLLVALIKRSTPPASPPPVAAA